MGPVVEGQEAPVLDPSALEQAAGLELEERLSGSEELRLRWYRSRDRLEGFEDRRILDYVEVVDRLNLNLTAGQVSFTAQGDAVALFGNRYLLDDVLYHERALYTPDVVSPFPDALFSLEKATVTWQGKEATLAVGDSYAAFGRGAALNLVKNTDVDVDTSIRGARVVLREGAWDFTFVSGVTNPQQVTLENGNADAGSIEADRYHGVHGVRVDRFGLGRFNLGAHGVVYQFARDAGLEPFAAVSQSPDAVVAGGSVEAVGLGGVDVYAEGDWFRYLGEGFAAEQGGLAYVSAAMYPGRASLLLEGKWQKNAEVLNTFAAPLQFEFAAGPTLEYERAITEDSSSALNSNDLWGGRARIDLPVALKAKDDAHLPPSLIPSVTVAAFRDSDLSDHFNRTPETIVHGLVGVLYIAGETHLQANVGYRRDQRDPSDELGSLGADQTFHGDVALAVPIVGKLSVEIAPSFIRYQWGRNEQQQEDFLDVSNALAVKLGSPWALVLYTDYSDNSLIEATGNITPTVYGGAELQWKPTTATTLKAFYGAYRAGIRCAGGQCRMLPGFDGGRLSLTTTF